MWVENRECSAHDELVMWECREGPSSPCYEYAILHAFGRGRGWGWGKEGGARRVGVGWGEEQGTDTLCVCLRVIGVQEEIILVLWECREGPSSPCYEYAILHAFGRGRGWGWGKEGGARRVGVGWGEEQGTDTLCVCLRVIGVQEEIILGLWVCGREGWASCFVNEHS